VEEVHPESPTDRQNVSGDQRRTHLVVDAPKLHLRSDEVDADVRVDRFSVDRVGPVTRLGGELSVTRGTVRVYAQDFEIEHARLFWDDLHTLDARIDARVVHHYPDSVLIGTASGTTDSPELVVASDPPIREQFSIWTGARVRRDIRAGGRFIVHGSSGDGTPGALDVLWLLRY